MKKLTLVCMVAMAAFIMSSCGNRNAKKAAEVQTVNTEVVAATCAQEGCCDKAECACEACKCAEGNCESCACEACKCADGNCKGCACEACKCAEGNSESCKCEECKCAETVTCCDKEATVAETEPVVAE